MDYQPLLEQARDYVLNYYQTHDVQSLVYHNQHHTESTVAAASKIANHYQLNDSDFFIVSAAAWFHDIGYLTGPTDHEARSVEIAREFFTGHGVGDDDVKLISGCILATKMPQSATTLIEEIICDADLFDLGTEDFFKNDKELLKEYNIQHNTDMSKLEWRKKTISFLENHTYYTDYCRLLLNETKEKNINTLKKKVLDKESEIAEPSPDTEVIRIPGAIDTPIQLNEGEKHKKDKGKKDKGKKTDRPDKGIETMFRISSSNHQRLSDMADRKAHIMITINSIILSAIISLVLRRLDTYAFLIVPSFILLAVSLAAMTFSILSTRPSIPKGIFSRADVDEKKVNLLFFGNFYKTNVEEYRYGMHKMMEDSEFLYDTLINDVYAQGIVLGKKYHLLRIGYNIFMFGLIVSVTAFIVAFLFFNHPSAIQIK